MVRLVEGCRSKVRQAIQFQFHYGTIGSPMFAPKKVDSLNSFNSTMVRLVVVCFRAGRLGHGFQFHYGTIGRY